MTFTNWQTWHGSNPPSSVGQDALIHLIDEDNYLDIKFLDWTQGSQGSGSGGGGGFLYGRSVCSAVVIDITDNNTDGQVTISQADTLSLAVSLDPDVQTGVDVDWWLLATTPSGVFYYDLASAS